MTKDHSWPFDALDPRPWLRCVTCLDGGMVEDADGNEDTCPTCEGGIWRERAPLGPWLNSRLPGFRLTLGWPFVYRTTRA